MGAGLEDMPLRFEGDRFVLFLLADLANRPCLLLVFFFSGRLQFQLSEDGEDHLKSIMEREDFQENVLEKLGVGQYQEASEHTQFLWKFLYKQLYPSISKNYREQFHAAFHEKGVAELMHVSEHSDEAMSLTMFHAKYQEICSDAKKLKEENDKKAAAAKAAKEAKQKEATSTGSSVDNEESSMSSSSRSVTTVTPEADKRKRGGGRRKKTERGPGSVSTELGKHQSTYEKYYDVIGNAKMGEVQDNVTGKKRKVVDPGKWYAVVYEEVVDEFKKKREAGNAIPKNLQPKSKRRCLEYEDGKEKTIPNDYGQTENIYALTPTVGV